MHIKILNQDTELAETVLAKPPKIFAVIVVSVTVLLIGAVAWAHFTEIDIVVKAPIRIRPVSFQSSDFNSISGTSVVCAASGKVSAVNFKAGDTVRKGDVLARLETDRLSNDISKFDNQIAQMFSKMQSARDEIARMGKMLDALDVEKEMTLRKAGAEISEAENDLAAETETARLEDERKKADERLAELEVEKQTKEVDRLSDMVRKDLIAKIELTKAEQALGEAREKRTRTLVSRGDSTIKRAQARLATVRQNYELVEKQFALRRQEIESKISLRDAETESDSRTLENLKIDRANSVAERDKCTIRAEQDGIVTVSDVHIGDVVQSGKAIAVIVSDETLRADAAVGPADIGRVRTGMAAKIKLDAFDYQKYGTIEGTVGSLSPDSQLLDNGRSSIFVCKIELTKTRLDGGYQPRLGMTGTCEVVVGKEGLLSMIFRDVTGKLSVD